MKRGVLILLSALSLSACTILDDIVPSQQPTSDGNGLELYTIKGGEHTSKSAISTFKGSKMVFEALFDSSAIYTTKVPSNQADINKLYGFSDCGEHHHTSSARFGWRWYNNELQIYAYTYLMGERKTNFVSAVPLGSKMVYTIEAKDDKYVFEVGTAQVTMARDCDGQARGYKLYPYFGGDEEAPHSIDIWLSEVE